MTFGRLPILIGACVLAGVLSGCQNARIAPGTLQHAHRPASDNLALPTPEILAYEQSPYGLTPQQRFEYRRRDYLTHPVLQRPILASDLWPQPLRPFERRVDFYYWKQ